MLDAFGKLHLGGEEIEAARHGAIALEDECAVVEPALAAEALRQAPGPGTLLTRRLVLGVGDDVLQAGKGPEALGSEQTGPEQHVFVGEGQQGSPVLIGHDPLERRLGPGRAVD